MGPALVPGSQNQNQADALGARSAQDVGRAVYEAHRKGLAARRERDLVAEKILLHIDGSGDNQWAEVYQGQRVAIPPDVSAYRISENLLKRIVDNQVAYHCTMPWRFIAEARQDRESREKAIIDAAFANYVARTQRANQLSAAAMYLADAIGFCPIHSFWRDDLGYDPYEPLYHTQDQLKELGLTPPRKGLIDLWVGNPFDTTFNAGAKRGSVQVARYGRVVPAEMVRARYGVQIEGTDKMPSASIFQRIARQWQGITGLDIHGGPVIQGGRGGEELLALICEERAPGVDPEFPDGRLLIVGLPGAAETRGGAGRGESAKDTKVLHDGPLPAQRFSWVNFYSDQRFDDITGAPWAEPLSDLQVQYNILQSKERELLEKALNAPIFVNGEIEEDSLDFNGYTVVQAMGMGGISARPMEMSTALFAALSNAIERKRQAMFTIGGYQAASRGEGSPGDSGEKVAILERADDTIHGPTNMNYRGSGEECAGLWWALMKEFGDVGWQIDAVGDEYEMLAEEYVDRTKLSDQPPSFKLVSGFGASPESRASQIMQAVTLRTADGEPFMRTEEARKQWPDGSMFENRPNPGESARRRAKIVNAKIRLLAKQFREQSGFDEQQIPPQWKQQAIAQAAMQVFQQCEAEYRRRRSDDLQANVETLAELIQDETEDPIARDAAELRQNQYFDWQMQMAALSAPMMDPEQGAGPQAPSGSNQQTEIEQDPAAPNSGEPSLSAA